MAALVFILVMLIALGNFADFLLGPKGGRRAKDRLVDFYVLTNGNDWRHLFRWVGAAMCGFMSRYLGSPGSLRYFWRVLLVSIPASTIVGLYFFIAIQDDTISFDRLFENLLSFWVAGYVVDLFSWYVGHRLFIFIQKSQFLGVILTIVISILAVYISMIVSMFLVMTLGYLLIGEPGVTVDLDFLSETLILAGNLVVADPLLSFGGAPAILTVAPALLPYLLFVTVLTLSALVAMSQSLAQRPLSLILQRAEESPRGVFSLAATCIASLIAILTAAQRLFDQP